LRVGGKSIICLENQFGKGNNAILFKLQGTEADGAVLIATL
jgi:hypothetical protein